MLFHSNACCSFETSVKEKRQYSPRSRSHESYLILLRCLLGKAADFSITVTDGVSDLQTRLSPFLRETRTDKYGKEVFVHAYTKEVADILSEAENFRTHEDNVEFVFSAEDGEWLLWAVPHHNQFSIDAEYFTDIDPAFLEEEQRLAETPTRDKRYAGQWGAPYILGDEDRWKPISRILYWTSDTIQFGGEEPVPFTEDVYTELSAYEDQYAEGDIRTFRDGYLLFFADAKEHRSLMDYRFVSNLGNYREPFREIRLQQIIEHSKSGGNSAEFADVWIPLRAEME